MRLSIRYELLNLEALMLSILKKRKLNTRYVRFAPTEYTHSLGSVVVLLVEAVRILSLPMRRERARGALRAVPFSSWTSHM